MGHRCSIIFRSGDIAGQAGHPPSFLPQSQKSGENDTTPPLSREIRIPRTNNHQRRCQCGDWILNSVVGAFPGSEHVHRSSAALPDGCATNWLSNVLGEVVPRRVGTTTGRSCEVNEQTQTPLWNTCSAHRGFRRQNAVRSSCW